MNNLTSDMCVKEEIFDLLNQYDLFNPKFHAPFLDTFGVNVNLMAATSTLQMIVRKYEPTDKRSWKITKEEFFALLDKEELKDYLVPIKEMLKHTSLFFLAYKNKDALNYRKFAITAYDNCLEIRKLLGLIPRKSPVVKRLMKLQEEGENKKKET